MLRRPALVGLAIALVAPLAACTQATRLPEAEPSSEIAPLFASDEEALAAATAAYEEYLVASSKASSSPDSDRDALRALTTPLYFEELSQAIDGLHAMQQRTEGLTRLASSTLQQSFEEPGGIATVIMYVCIDVSPVRVVDFSGVDLTPSDREVLVSLEVEMLADRESPPQLRVARSESWAGGDQCGG